MKFVSTTLIAAALLAASAAHAGVSQFTGATNGDSDADQRNSRWSNPELAVTLELSTLFIGTLNFSGVQISQVDPASVYTTVRLQRRYVTAGVTAPVQSLELDEADQVVELSTHGGFRLTVESDGFTTFLGGSLLISNMRIDLQGQRIHADVVGSNGVGTISGLHMWNFKTGGTPALISGHTSQGHEFFMPNLLTDLSFSEPGLKAYLESLGLNMPIGEDAVSTASNQVGQVSIHAVPEPSTFVLTGLGLALMGLAAHRPAGSATDAAAPSVAS
jgi:hypothetical protein